jgi:hypothetical protein
MANLRTPDPVKLFTGVLTSLPQILPGVEKRLSDLFGPVDSHAGPYPFDQTRYYDEEMGKPICRYFFSFTGLIDGAEIAAIKAKTNGIESEFAAANHEIARPVNIDPGYLEQSKIVLASTKNFYHRVLVSSGIYAEVTLHFEDKQWRAFPWTFPDYKSGRYDPYFLSLRTLYRRQLGSHQRKC